MMTRNANDSVGSFSDSYWQGKRISDMSREELIEAFWAMTIARDSLVTAFNNYLAGTIVKVMKTEP